MRNTASITVPAGTPAITFWTNERRVWPTSLDAYAVRYTDRHRGDIFTFTVAGPVTPDNPTGRIAYWVGAKTVLIREARTWPQQNTPAGVALIAEAALWEPEEGDPDY